MILLDSESATFTLLQFIAAGLFLIGGVWMVIQTLRHNLFKSKLALEEEERRAQARAEYWRTMEAAVETLSSIVEEIDEKIEDRSATLARLSAEAEESIAALSRSMENAETELEAAHAERTASSKASGRRASGKVVNMKAASAALVRRTHRQIYEAFDMGRNIQDISRETGLGIGEIELILALRERIERQGS